MAATPVAVNSDAPALEEPVATPATAPWGDAPPVAADFPGDPVPIEPSPVAGHEAAGDPVASPAIGIAVETAPTRFHDTALDGDTVPYAEAQVDDEERHRAAHSGPNWMLALVCGIAGATALWEAWKATSWHVFPSYAFSGYLTLGIGVALFGLEALTWGRRRSWAWLIYVPATLLILGGVIFLALSTHAGRKI